MPSSCRPAALARAAAVTALLIPAALLTACSGASTAPRTPAGTAVVASSAPSGTAVPTAAPIPTPSPSPAGPACTGGDLDVLFGAESSASGGEQGMTALLANDSGTACLLSGSLQAQLLTGSGGALSTTLQSPAPAGSAWLVPDRVALDAWWPQSGEATVTISWHTGDVQPGVCSGSAPSVGEVSLSIPGGGTVIGSLGDSLIEMSVAPCDGVIQLGAIVAATTPEAFSSPTAGAQAAGQEEFAGQGPPNPSYQVTTGSQAAVVAYGGPDCGASTYLWQDGAGWHVLDTTCSQAPGYSPGIGLTDWLYGPAGSGCAAVHASPGHASAVTACLTTSTTFGQGTHYTVDQGPAYAAETDPTSQLPEGTIWWHLQGQGWVTQDYLVELTP
ncbi:MAG: hypothetical protein ABR950_09975 [Candidatus Dormibacteria bacterium]|jgi:hypothetical protein